VELNLSSEVDNIKNIQNKMLTTLEQVRIGGLVINTWGQHQRDVSLQRYAYVLKKIFNFFIISLRLLLLYLAERIAQRVRLPN
jgi:hypothetical protein